MPSPPLITTGPEELREHYDMAIIGSGGAGLTAALQAAELGLSVVVLEKSTRIGGNTIRASSGMNAAETQVQLDHRIVDSFDSFHRETLRGGEMRNDPALLSYFVQHAPAAIEWLARRGIAMEDLTITGGMSRARTHRPASLAPIGSHLITGLARRLGERAVPVVTGAAVTRLLAGASGVRGVAVDAGGHELVLGADAVVLATGGFAANASLVARHRPELAAYRTTNHPGATGDGIELARAVGAGLVDMDRIQVHPTVQQDGDRAYLIGEAVRGEGAVLVARAGHRFCDELDTRQRVTAAIDALGEGGAHLLLDQGVRERVAAVDFYDRMGLVRSAPDLDALAAEIGADARTLARTVDTWNAGVRAGADPEFGRTTGMGRGIGSAPFQAIRIAPAVHFTMGGLRADDRARVLDEDGHAIAGLFAAGEVVGGLHGADRIGGNSVSETVVFGLQAARQAFRALTER